MNTPDFHTMMITAALFADKLEIVYKDMIKAEVLAAQRHLDAVYDKKYNAAVTAHKDNWKKQDKVTNQIRATQTRKKNQCTELIIQKYSQLRTTLQGFNNIYTTQHQGILDKAKEDANKYINENIKYTLE